MTVRSETAIGKQRLCFRAGDRRFGVPLASVLHVTVPAALAWLPRQPDWLRGLANVGGEVVAVIDLAVWSGRSAVPSAPRLLVVEARGERVGLLVDEVIGISAAPPRADRALAGGGAPAAEAAPEVTEVSETILAAGSAEVPAARAAPLLDLDALLDEVEARLAVLSPFQEAPGGLLDGRATPVPSS